MQPRPPTASSQHPPAACTLQEAAAELGISLNTLRRRISAGQVRADRVERPQGFVWRVWLAERQPASQHAASTLPQPPTDVLRAEAMATYTRSLLEPLVVRLAEQERIIRDQAAQLGAAHERIKMLEAPKEPEPDPAPTPEPSPPTTDGREPHWLARLTAWLGAS